MAAGAVGSYFWQGDCSVLLLENSLPSMEDRGQTDCVTMTVTFIPLRAMVMTHKHAKL